ncbi:hypothetical protein BESB_054320 [Besnoitia besnoiti]|uniref:Transmembrane protein n=1 Tax=Besnoitia besnoiti TaxID=94643 RepID=A0A2A9MHP6_BESBE|nr:hypothetical protein BESB_054320 [Besnoitia besnoiti]PFH35781.1 hypothetical protein BESB_054320 [Besnoitia besnoiti]
MEHEYTNSRSVWAGESEFPSTAAASSDGDLQDSKDFSSIIQARHTPGVVDPRPAGGEQVGHRGVPKTNALADGRRQRYERKRGDTGLFIAGLIALTLMGVYGAKRLVRDRFTATVSAEQSAHELQVTAASEAPSHPKPASPDKAVPANQSDSGIEVTREPVNAAIEKEASVLRDFMDRMPWMNFIILHYPLIIALYSPVVALVACMLTFYFREVPGALDRAFGKKLVNSVVSTARVLLGSAGTALESLANTRSKKPKRKEGGSDRENPGRIS